MTLKEAMEAFYDGKFLTHSTFDHAYYIRWNKHANTIVDSIGRFQSATDYWNHIMKYKTLLNDDGWEEFKGDPYPQFKEFLEKRTYHPKKGYTTKKQNDE